MPSQFQTSAPQDKFIGTVCQIGLDAAHLEERRRESAICFGFRTKKAVFKVRGKHKRAVEDSIDAEPCCPQWGSQSHRLRPALSVSEYEGERGDRRRSKSRSWKKHRRNRWSKTQIMSALGAPLTARV